MKQKMPRFMVLLPLFFLLFTVAIARGQGGSLNDVANFFHKATLNVISSRKNEEKSRVSSDHLHFKQIDLYENIRNQK